MAVKEKEKQLLYNNKGITLIELLISITILAIVVLPLLYNFVTAVKVNAKSKQKQIETIYTQNLMEEVKALRVADLVARFNYPEDFLINEQVIEMVVKDEILQEVEEGDKGCIRYRKEDGSFSYTLRNGKNTPYYLAMKNITLGRKSYDVLITLDHTCYQKENVDSATIAFNSYEMPAFSDLDEVNNLLVFQSYEEETAISALYMNHLRYMEGLEKNNPSTTVVYNSEEDIRNNLTKDIDVFITGSNPYNATVTFTYTADSIPGAGTITYTLGNKPLDASKGSIYIFFYPSIYNYLSIHKDSLITEDIDIYSISQRSSTWSGNELVLKNGVIPNGIHLYSNSSQIKDVSGNGLVKKSSPKNGIYKVKVQLFTSGNHFREDALCVELTSTKEE